MPKYDFRCARGHVTEATTGREVRAMPCTAGCNRGPRALCGLTADRVAVPSRVGVCGLLTPPIHERRVYLARAIEAQHQLVDQAERAHVQLPDLLGAAKRRAAAIKRHAPEILG